MDRLTKAEARERAVLGWNLRCGRCGTYGALWRDAVLSPGRVRLCDGCEDVRQLALRALREAEHMRVAQAATDQMAVV